MNEFDVYNLGLYENKYWESEWKEVISTDQHYDGDYLIRLMTHKLKLMLNYFSNKAEEITNGKLSSDNDIVYIISMLNECYLLGLKILNYNYGKEADELFDKFGSMIWLSEDFKDKNYNKWKSLTKKAEKDRLADINKFFSLISKNINNWWV